MKKIKDFIKSLPAVYQGMLYFIAFGIIGSLVIGGIVFACQYPNVHLNLW